MNPVPAIAAWRGIAGNLTREEVAVTPGVIGAAIMAIEHVLAPDAVDRALHAVA